MVEVSYVCNGWTAEMIDNGWVELDSVLNHIVFLKKKKK